MAALKQPFLILDPQSPQTLKRKTHVMLSRFLKISY